MRKTISLFSLILVFSFLLSACLPSGVTIDLPSIRIERGETQAATPTPAPAISQAAPPAVSSADASSLLAAMQGTLTQIYEQVNPGVVNVQVAQPALGANGLPFDLPGDSGDLPLQQGVGSGFVWDKLGHIVTNNHVVNGAEQINVRFADGTIAEARLVGSDPDSDLAVLKVDLPPEQLFPLTLADSSNVKVGQLAIAIGNPFGLEGTMTVGIVSALGRSLPVENSLVGSGATYSIPDVIQTDAPINPGNSGGVLLDDRGQVIGVTAAIESPVRANAGIGFVIPANIVSRVVPVLISDGRFEHPYLGISGTSLTPALAEAMDLPAGTRGALVMTVTAGGPAEAAGLRGGSRNATINGATVQVGGDVITAIAGQPVTSFDDLVSYLGTQAEVGQRVELTILRGGNSQSVPVTLASRPGATPLPETRVETASRGGYLGINGMTMIPALAEAMNLDSATYGVLVLSVEEGSPAAEAGLRAGLGSYSLQEREVRIGGDIITAVDGQKVESIQALRENLAGYNPGDTVRLTILRGDETLDLEVTLAQRP